MAARGSSARADPAAEPSTGRGVAPGASPRPDGVAGGAAIQRCVREELRRHLELLDGEPPSDLYRLVMRQVETSLLDAVLAACDGNRSRAAAWLGIGRGTLRTKLADLDHDRTRRS